MHNNIYDHDKSESGYKHYISEICYRLQIEVIQEGDITYKIADGDKVELAGEHPRNTLWYRSWMSLLDEYSLHDESWAYGRKS